MKPLLLACLLWPISASLVLAEPSLNDFLARGQIDEALAAYAQPQTDAARFSLAAAQVLKGVRDFSAAFNALSVHPNLRTTPLPFLRVIVQDAPSGSPHVATPAAVATAFRNFQTSLQQANATLAAIEGKKEFGVPLDLRQARLDFSGDGTINPETETFQAAFARVLGTRAAADAPLVVQFDQADAAWLKGYTHFLIGMIELLSAYDWTPVWNQCAHLIFLKPDPVPAIARLEGSPMQWGSIPDYIAAVHDMRLDLVDPQAIRRSRDSFLLMIAQSRDCWRRALQETDDVNEWLPNPKQKGPAGATVTQAQIDGWLKVLDEMETVAQGGKLLPHWRIKNGSGINIERLVAAPPKLDLVLWLQGSAFAPYVEEGEVSDAVTWRELQRPFGPGFIQFAIWSN